MTETVFYRRLMKLCEEKGLSLTALAKEIGKGSATASGWKHGAIPRPDTLRLIADYFGVTTGYLLGDESVKTGDIHTNNGIIGHAHAPVTIINGSERLLSANNYIDESGRPRTVNIEDSGFPTDPVKGSTLKSNPPPKQNKANPFEDILVFQDCFALIIKIADRQ